MKAIGLRVESHKSGPSILHWAIVSGTKDAPVREASDSIQAPKVASEITELTSLCRDAMAVVAHHKPDRAWVREAERTGFGKKFLLKRCRVEGALIAAMVTAGIDVNLGALTSISASLKPATAPKARAVRWSAKPLLSQPEFRKIDWDDDDLTTREAILCAVAALV